MQYEEQLLNLWHFHQERLRNNLCADALLLDCHSFPEELSDIDICIGYNEDWSKPDKETIELAVNLFEDHGYVVGINEPYSNSETPDCPFGYQSMMLEVNKKAYMEDGTLRLKHNHDHRKNIRQLMISLLSELSESLGTGILFSPLLAFFPFYLFQSLYKPSVIKSLQWNFVRSETA